MNRSGRASILSILGCVALLVCVVLVLMSARESITTVGARFMSALAKGDAEELTKMTYLGSESAEDVRKQWDFAVNTAGKYYNFRYRILGADQADSKNASVRLAVVRDADRPGGYEQNYQLPLTKVGDEWKVDVRGISREMYPALPE